MSTLSDTTARLREASRRLDAGESVKTVAAAVGLHVKTLQRVSEISAFGLLDPIKRV